MATDNPKSHRARGAQENDYSQEAVALPTLGACQGSQPVSWIVREVSLDPPGASGRESCPVS